MKPAAPLVSLRAVSFDYPLPGAGSRSALCEVSLEVFPGDSLVVLGANGAGKSTLAALLAGGDAPTAGAVHRAPVPAHDAPAVLPVGLVTQNPEDCFSTSLVREEMGVVLENLERDPDEIDRAVDAMLAAIGLDGHADAHPARLSGGQKQLLAIASVLVAEPPLLVLDEPFTLLDGPGRAEAEVLLSRAEGPGCARIFLSSEVEDASRGERVLVLHRGSVVWDGPPGDLPQDAATLGAWGLVPPDIAVLGAGLRAAGHPVLPPYRDPERMAREVVSGLPGPAGSAASSAGGVRQGVERPPLEAATRDGHPDGARGCGSLTVTDLHFSYAPGSPDERPVLRGVDFTARPGEVLGVIGAIGSGKTTLIQHLNGLFPPQRGRVVVGDRVLEPGVKIRQLLHREVGMVFQFPEKQLFAESVEEDVGAGPDFAGVPESEIPGRVRAALERVGLDPAGYGPRAPFALTWGEKRLVAIAGVLVLETPHLVLDEPGAGLDPAARRRVMDLLADLAHREGRTVLVVSHHLDDLFRVADRVAVLHEGRIAFCGTPAQLCREGDPARWGLLWPPRSATPRTPPPRS